MPSTRPPDQVNTPRPDLYFADAGSGSESSPRLVVSSGASCAAAIINTVVSDLPTPSCETIGRRAYRRRTAIGP